MPSRSLETCYTRFFMSNYIFGYFTPENGKDAASVTKAIRAQSAIGFHIVEADEYTRLPPFDKLEGKSFFYLSDDNDTEGAEGLILKEDWGEDYKQNPHLPMKLIDRIALIVDAIGLVFELSNSPMVGLWISEVDQLEDTVQVSLAALFETITADFEYRGIPCILYEITP